MLKRTNRFHGHGSLQSAYTRGNSVRGQYFSAKVLHRKNGTLRVAVVVSTKISKIAPVRNRIRRRLYELVRTQVVTNQPVDLVITTYSDVIASMPAKELREQFIALCKQAELICKEQ